MAQVIGLPMYPFLFDFARHRNTPILFIGLDSISLISLSQKEII